MNPIAILIRDRIMNADRRHVQGGHVRVSERDMMEILDELERLETTDRVTRMMQRSQSEHAGHILCEAMSNYYIQNGKDAAAVMYLVSSELKQLTEREMNERAFGGRGNGHLDRTDHAYRREPSIFTEPFHGVLKPFKQAKKENK